MAAAGYDDEDERLMIEILDREVKIKEFDPWSVELIPSELLRTDLKTNSFIQLQIFLETGEEDSSIPILLKDINDEDKMKLLRECLVSNNTNGVIILLKNIIFSKGTIADIFIQSVKSNQLPIVRFIFGNHLVSLYDVYAVLKIAVEYDRFSIIKYFIDQDIDISIEDDILLRKAVKLNNVSIAELLIENGANIHSREDIVLRTAVELNNFEMVKMLLEHGANVNIKRNWPLRKAELEGFDKIATFIRDWMMLVDIGEYLK